MSVSTAGQSPATFELKSANLPLLALLLKSTDMTALAHELAAEFGGNPDFFDHDPLVIDLTPLQGAPGAAPRQIDFDALLVALRPYRVAPIAVRGGTAAQMQAAFRVGLAPAPDAQPLRPPPAAAAPPPPAAPAIDAASGALIVNRPLRSGQRVYARGRDLVCLAMVNPGAEVVADGHIHVYAPLRGKVIAGASGDVDARIFAMNMEPELIAIAGVYRTREHDLPAEVRGKPTQVHLAAGPEGDKLVMTPLAFG